jgi:hypothetical protein
MQVTLAQARCLVADADTGKQQQLQQQQRQQYCNCTGAPMVSAFATDKSSALRIDSIHTKY